MITDVLRDAWPWVLVAFLLGLLIGWLVTWLYYRGVVADERQRAADLQAKLNECEAKGSTAKRAAAKPAAKSTTKASASTKAAPVAAFDAKAARAVIGKTVKQDDLKLIEGIGPKIEGLFKADGIATWADLADAKVSRLNEILDAAGPRYNIHDPGTWPRQAKLLANGEWAKFKKLTDELDGGR